MAKKQPPRIWTDKDRAIVKRMAMIGVSHEIIAKALKVRKATLEADFAEELANSASEANAAVAGALFKNAMSGNVAAQIFWCKTRLGWKEKFEHEHGGKDGGPLQAVLEVVRKTKE